MTKNDVLRWFTSVDKNSDGILSRDEIFASTVKNSRPSRTSHDRSWQAGFGRSAHWGAGHRAPFGGISAEGLIKRFDKDLDGVISKSESPEPAWNRFLKRMDTDQDGRITKVELEKSLKASPKDRRSPRQKPSESGSGPQSKPEGEAPLREANPDSKPETGLNENSPPSDALSAINSA